MLLKNESGLNISSRFDYIVVWGICVKCIFNPSIVCPFFEAQKELGYTPNIQEIQEKECPQCPHRINSVKTNQVDIKPVIPSQGNYIV